MHCEYANFTVHSKALEALYEWQQTAYLNSYEARIHRVYQRLQLGIKPWEWDHENYAEDHPEYIGFFFPEDIENMWQIRQFEIEYAKRESKKK